MPSKRPLIVNPVGLHVGKRIAFQRLAKGFTQARLAEAINVTPLTLQRYETGTRGLPLFRLAQICAVLEISPDVLFHKVPLEFGRTVPISTGTLENGDTRRLLRAWDQITGRARKRMLSFVVTLARASREQDELVGYRRAAGVRVHPEDDPE